MFLFKKINNYLLENYPLAWHSKVVYMTLIGVVLWALSYFVGYSLVDIEVLKENHILSYYFSSYFFLFHLIITITILSLWAISFYKNNAFKNFYPISRWYFNKLFFHLFIPFFLIISAYYPFSAGVKSKTATFFTESDLRKDIDKLNIGNAFLVSNEYEYNLNKKVYPKPFPLEYVVSINSKRYNTSSNTVIRKKTGKLITFDPYQYENEYSIELGENKYIFYKEHKFKEKLFNGSYIQKRIVYLVHPSKIDAFSENSVLNFSSILFTNYPKIENRSFVFSFFNNDFNEYDHSKEFRKNYAKLINRWVVSKNYGNIEASIEEFKSVCKKYNIEYNINTRHLMKYLIFKNFKNFSSSIIKESQYTSSTLSPEDEMNLIESKLRFRKETIINMENQHVYNYDSYSLDRVIQNFRAINSSLFGNDSLLPIMYVLLSLIWLFIFFEFTKIKPFLISIPVLGVISVITSITLILVNSNIPYKFHQIIIEGTIIFLSLVIIIWTLIGVYLWRVKRGFLNILLNLTYFIAPGILLYIAQFLDTCFKDPYSEISGNTIWKALVNPYIELFLFALGINLFYLILKKWKSLEE